jgi:hypothetical protein
MTPTVDREDIPPCGSPRISMPLDPDLWLGRHWHRARTSSASSVGLTLSNATTVAPPRNPVDFSDPESQRALTAAARVVASVLGRQAAREYWDRTVH